MNPQINTIDFNEPPFIAIWEVTQACDLACVHCRASGQPCHRGPWDGVSLPTEVALRDRGCDADWFDEPAGIILQSTFRSALYMPG